MTLALFLLPLSQPDTRAAAVLINELDAGVQGAADHVESCTACSGSEQAGRMLDFLLASREPGKLLHTFSNFRPRQTQLMELLEVQPKLPADAKPVAKTQRRVRRDATLAIDDSVRLRQSICAPTRCRNVELPQLFGKMLAGVNRGARHDMLPLVVITARLDTTSIAVGVARWPIYPSQDAIGLSQRSP